MLFGNTVTEAMERGEEWCAFIPRYPKFEHKMFIEVEGVPIMAFVDNMCPDTIAFKEQKTGRTPWTQNKVDNHLQLDIYSMLLEEEFGKVVDECELVWVKTEKVPKKVMMGDIELEGESTEIQVTGEFEVFKRVITEEDRDEVRKTIIRVAHEIEEDFSAMKHLYE